MSKFLEELKSHLVRGGYEPKYREDSLEVYPLLRAVSYLARRDALKTFDLKSFQKTNRVEFLISMCHICFDINVPYIPGFFRSMDQPTLQLCYMLFQQSYKCIPIVEVESPLPELTAEEQLNLERPSTMIDRVLDYVSLGLDGVAIPVLKQDYSDHLMNYNAFAHRLPLIMDLIAQVPEYVKIIAPGDGVGVAAVSCLLLGREYYASEPNDIGAVARDLGIIQSRATAEELISTMDKYDREPILVILSNIAIYCDISEYCRCFPVLVLEAQGIFKGSNYLHSIPDSGCRLWTNTDIGFKVCNRLMEGVPNYDRFLSKNKKYMTKDPRAYIELRSASYNVVACAGSDLAATGVVEIGDGEPVSYNFLNQCSDNDFVLTYRKFANAVAGRPGQYRQIGDNWYEFSRQKKPRVCENGFNVTSDKNYISRRVLQGLNFGLTENVKTIKVKFDPTPLRYAYCGEIIVPVVVTSVERNGDHYKAIITRQWDIDKRLDENINLSRNVYEDDGEEDE